MYAMTPAQFNAVGSADFLVSDFISKWGCAKSLLSDNGEQCSSGFLRAVCKLIGVRNSNTIVYHEMGNAGTKLLNHTIAQLLSIVVNGPQSH